MSAVTTGAATTSAATVRLGRRGAVGRIVRAVAAMLAIALLASCARIPLDGPVMAGQEVVSDQQQDVRFLPDPPAPGASPLEIVRGFLEAGTGTQSNYETARAYLTDARATTWDPTARVLVHADPPTYEQVSDTTVRATITVVAEVGADGTYRELTPPQPRTLDFAVQNVSGEWRIETTEDGIALLREPFTRVFSTFTLFFFDPSFRYLVPDVRWFPNHTTAPTRIVQGLLGGPADWLGGGAVASAFPGDTVLRGPVTTEGTVAVADFSPSISTVSNDRFSLMFLQLRESLAGYASISDVRMSVNGATLDISLPPEGAVQAHAEVNATPLVYRDGQIGYISGDTLTPPAGSERLAAVLANLQPTRGAVSVDQQFGAFVTPRGVMAVPFETGQPVAIDARDGLASPSIDPYGFIWTASSTSEHVAVTDLAGRAEASLEIGGFGRDGILSLQVSREGARLAAIVRDGNRYSLVIAAVLRQDAAGIPTGIGDPVVLQIGPGAPIQVAWVDETSIALLEADAVGSSTVRVYRIGGEAEDYGAVEGGTQIAGSNTRAGLRVMDSSGGLWVPRNNRWQATGARIGFLITQA